MSRVVRSLLAVMLGVALCAACGDSGEEDAGETSSNGGDGGTSNGVVDNGSPVHAIASVMRLEDSTGPFVEARLILLSTATETPEFVDDAEEVTLSLGGAEFTLPPQAVELGPDRTRATMFVLNDRTAAGANLKYEGSATATISFVLRGREAGDFDGETFTLEASLPPTNNNLATAGQPTQNTPLDLIPGQIYTSGILEVFKTQSGDTTFISYPYSDRFIEGVSDLMNDHAELNNGGGSILTVPATAFNRSGTHTVIHIGLTVHRPGEAQLSTNLGPYSVMYAGASAQIQVDVP